MLHFGLAVPPTSESVLLAQGWLCIVGRIGAFDVDVLRESARSDRPDRPLFLSKHGCDLYRLHKGLLVFQSCLFFKGAEK